MIHVGCLEAWKLTPTSAHDLAWKDLWVQTFQIFLLPAWIPEAPRLTN